MERKISVITPFFQRHPGLLRKAIESVTVQKNLSAKVEVIVVDDGSPVPADTEVAGMPLPSTVNVKIVKQANAGCYPACNKALNHVGEDTDYIAFLDSDDEWFDTHLDNAVWALENGYDIYFSDFYQLNQTVSAFRRAGRIDPDAHRKIHPTRPIHEFGGSLYNQILSGNVLGTSTIVYDRRKLGDLRYLEDFRHTGAEYILWLSMASRSNRVAFSAEPECRYGGGVNIFSEAAWGTDKYLTVRQDEMKYRKYILSNMTLSDDQRRHLKKKIHEARVGFCLGFIHNLLHNRRIGDGILRRRIQADPLTLATLLIAPGIAGVLRLKRSTEN